MLHRRQTLGLEAFEHRGEEEQGRWFFPLTRSAAARVRARIEVDASREPLFPTATLAVLRAIEALVFPGPGYTLRYVLGGELAALRRVLIVEARIGLEEALRAAGLSDELGPASPDELERHHHAMRLARWAPRELARAWVDGDTWPPEADQLAAMRARVDEFDAARSPNLARGLVESGELLALEVLVNSASAVHEILRRGFVPARWRLLSGEALDGLSPERDLRSGGAAFVFARLLTRARLGQPLPDGLDYALWLDPLALDREDRFLLRTERYGSLHALAEAMSDPEIDAAVRGATLPAHHELLFPRALPASLVLGVQCRTEDAEAELGPVRVPSWVDPRRRSPPPGPW